MRRTNLYLRCSDGTLDRRRPCERRRPHLDGFEATTLNPFWSTSIQSGSIALSTGQAHGGSQSVQLSSTDTGVTKSIQLFHDFATPVYGVTSVWVLDTGTEQIQAIISHLASTMGLSISVRPS